MKKLSAVPEKVAARILSKVSFENRFIGGRLRHHAGMKRVTSYRFEEIIHLLNDPWPVLNPEALGRWIREVMSDVDLAEEIARVIETESSYPIITSHIRSLMEERLDQCRRLALHL